MKLILIFICIISASCCSTKKTLNNPKPEDTTEIQNPLLQSVSVCITNLVEKFKAEEKQNPPRKIMSYTYRDKTVYYVTAPCCDFYSDLYDDNCKLIGHPDGGITGKGDGKLPDFEKSRSNEKLIWEDKR
jgi:hypothetical protein